MMDILKMSILIAYNRINVPNMTIYTRVCLVSDLHSSIKARRTCPNFKIISHTFSEHLARINMPRPHGANVAINAIIMSIVASSIVEHGSRKKPVINLIMKGMAPMPTTVDTDVINIDRFISPRSNRAKLEIKLKTLFFFGFNNWSYP